MNVDMTWFKGKEEKQKPVRWIASKLVFKNSMVLIKTSIDDSKVFFGVETFEMDMAFFRLVCWIGKHKAEESKFM